MNIPIIKIELEGIKKTLYTALNKDVIDFDAGIKSALDKYCSESHIHALVENEALKVIEEAVKEEVRVFFRHTNTGRLAIKEAVTEYLELMYPTDAKLNQGRPVITEPQEDNMIWKPIETAPKDGTPVLLLTTTGVVSAWFCHRPTTPGSDDGNYEWVCYDDAFIIEGDQGGATHWMPLPPKPEEEDNEMEI